MHGESAYETVLGTSVRQSEPVGPVTTVIHNSVPVRSIRPPIAITDNVCHRTTRKCARPCKGRAGSSKSRAATLVVDVDTTSVPTHWDR
jgi:hypothetical protein